MYRNHFGFNIKPFQINTDPRFLWLGEKHAEALSVLKYGVLENRGFLLLTGDVGTGKTTLLNALLKTLPSDVLVARIPDPKLDVMDFIRILAGSLRVEGGFETRGQFLGLFEKFLKKQHILGKHVLIIIDEAQRLTHELLEEIRALSNLEKADSKFLNVFFIGQNEFNDILLDYKNRALRQRITINYHLEALNRKEVGEYVWHRQKVADGKKNLFSKKAIDRIYAFSGGFPRLINIICDHALLSAYAADKKLVSDAIVAECARDLEIRSHIPPPAPAPPAPAATASDKEQMAARSSLTSKRRGSPLAAAAAVLLLLLGIYMAYRGIPESAGWFQSTPEKARPPSPSDPSENPGLLGSVSKSRPNPGQAAANAGLPHEQITTDSERKAEQGQNTEVYTGQKPAPRQSDAGRQATPPSDAPRHSGLAAVPKKAAAPEPAVRSKPQAQTGTESGSGDETPLDAMLKARKKLVVYFPSDTYKLDQRSIETLALARRLLRNNPDVEVRVEGYSDSLGDPDYNRYLSEIRADMVKSYLAGNGIRADQIESVGYGAQNPMTSNQTREGRSLNRRVEILFDFPAH